MEEGMFRPVQRHICRTAGEMDSCPWIYVRENSNCQVWESSRGDQNTELIFCRLNFNLLESERGESERMKSSAIRISALRGGSEYSFGTGCVRMWNSSKGWLTADQQMVKVGGGQGWEKGGALSETGSQALLAHCGRRVFVTYVCMLSYRTEGGEVGEVTGKPVNRWMKTFTMKSLENPNRPFSREAL